MDRPPEDFDSGSGPRYQSFIPIDQDADKLSEVEGAVSDSANGGSLEDKLSVVKRCIENEFVVCCFTGWDTIPEFDNTKQDNPTSQYIQLLQ